MSFRSKIAYAALNRGHAYNMTCSELLDIIEDESFSLEKFTKYFYISVMSEKV